MSNFCLALRGFRGTPAFTATAVLILALGIGMAAYLPARRTTWVDPALALGAEV